MIFSRKTYIFFLVGFVSLILFSYFFVDKTVAKYFLENIPKYEHVGDILSIAGESHWYIGAGIIGFIFFKYIKKNRLYEQRFLFLLYINLFSGLISLLLKWLFSRIRPWGLRDGHDEYGFLLFQNFDMGFLEKMKYHFATLFESPTTYSSFPSGHTTTVVAVMLYLYILFPRYLYFWISLALVMASSRILANDHFISDILAGVIIGTLSTLYLYSKMKDKLEKKS
jgi:membrane-associated phospholipid phosphatase